VITQIPPGNYSIRKWLKQISMELLTIKAGDHALRRMQASWNIAEESGTDLLPQRRIGFLPTRIEDRRIIDPEDADVTVALQVVKKEQQDQATQP
jgi:hypothetical protein